MPRPLLSVVALVLIAAPAHAALFDFEGTLSIEGFGSLVPSGTGTGLADVTASGTHLVALQVPGGLVSVQSTTVSPPSVPFSRIEVSLSDGSGSFATSPGGNLAGTLPARGGAELFLFGFSGVLPFTQNGTRGVGLGGGPITLNLGFPGTVMLQGDDWTTGAVAITTLSGTPMRTGFAMGPLAATSSTVSPSGMVRLVTPVQITANTIGGSFQLAVFGIFDVHLIPEPRSAVLLLVGAGGLLLLGRSRR